VDGVQLKDAQFQIPAGILFNAAENALYLCDGSNHVVRRIDLKAETVGTFAGSGKAGFLDGTGVGAQFNTPQGIAKYDKENSFFVADHANHRIRKIASTGVVSVFAGNGTAASVDGQGTNASFHYPLGISINQQNGDIFVSDFGTGKIRRVTQHAQVSTIASGVQHPYGVCYNEKQDCLYIAEYGRHSILRLEIKSGAVSPAAGNGGDGCLDGDGSVAQFNHPSGVAIESDSSLLVADTFNNRIRRITFTGGGQSIVETVIGNESGFLDGDFQTAKFNYPNFLCIDSATSTCYVADGNSHRIQKIGLR